MCTSEKYGKCASHSQGPKTSDSTPDTAPLPDAANQYYLCSLWSLPPGEQRIEGDEAQTNKSSS